MLPFTRDEFLDLFAAYNASVWPAQPLAYGLGAVAMLALAGGSPAGRRLALALIGVMWLWTGIAYHWLFFAEINPAAVAFALLFGLQGAAFLAAAAAAKPGFDVGGLRSPSGTLGAALIAYAFAVYPLIDLMMGHWPRMPAFGISPCPVTLFTLGLLLLARPRPPLRLWIIPVLWSLIGGTAAFLLGIVQDWVLLAAGPAALAVAFLPKQKRARTTAR